jgi:prevent-host-death family protein
MSKEVTVEELREKIEDVIASVDAGETVEIVRNGEKIASVTPAIVRGSGNLFRDLDPGAPLSKPLDIDVVDLLSEDREDRF